MVKCKNELRKNGEFSIILEPEETQPILSLSILGIG